MPDPIVSRRQFVVAGAAALATGTARPRGAPTAREIVDRVRARIGVPWRDGAGDGFRAGDPDTPVTGIAVAAMPTLDVLRRAAAAGHNLVVTHERAFYGPGDPPSPPASDPVHAARRALVEDRRLVVFRLAEHWNARVPNENARALAEALGWDGRGRDGARVYDVAPTTAGDVVALARARLGARGLRLVGDARAPVRRVLVSPGTTELRDTVQRLPGADLLLAGEPREWEAVEYVLDTAAAGRRKAMIALGRVVSEEPGLRACAAWLRPLASEVLVRHLPSGDPYWTAQP